MLSRVKGDIVFTCDDCDDELDTATDDFDTARQELKDKAWVTRKDGSDWLHYCPDCKPATAGEFKRWMD